tara:strand:- start:242 stop:1015 length:774 start_codon:yes stop_codon:yes gene_type:complete
MQNIQPIYSPMPNHIEKREISALNNMFGCTPVGLITAKYKDKSNIMPASKIIHLSTDPPFIGVAIEQSRFTLDIIKAAESFAINIPTLSLLHYVAYLGNYSGEQMDKISFLQLETFTPITITAPLLQQCCAWVETEVHDIKKIGNHELVIGYPKKILVDPKSFDDKWQLGSVDTRPLIYLDNQRYSVFGQSFEAKLPTKSENHHKILQEVTKEHLAKISEENEKLDEKMYQIKKEIGTDLISDMTAAIINEELKEED